jgi:FHA domain
LGWQFWNLATRGAVKILIASTEDLMAANPANVVAATRRPARDLIEAVLENMRRNLEPLKYSTLAPSRFVIYLHPREYARLEGIVELLRKETQRALAEELDRLNRRSAMFRYVRRWSGRSEAPVTNPASEWHVEFVGDPDEELAEGDILIDSDLVLPAQPDLGAGEQTRRIRTKHSGQHTTTMREYTSTRVPAADPVLARIAYDDNTGHHTYELVRDSVTIGRGGVSHPVDICIVAAVDISREHARIRRDRTTGRFFLIDLSSLGTTLNGRHVPRGYEEVEGTKRENGAETLLPDQARIGLADTVYLDFRRAS